MGFSARMPMFRVWAGRVENKNNPTDNHSHTYTPNKRYYYHYYYYTIPIHQLGFIIIYIDDHCDIYSRVVL